jgi:hypothetical protein
MSYVSIAPYAGLIIPLGNMGNNFHSVVSLFGGVFYDLGFLKQEYGKSYDATGFGFDIGMKISAWAYIRYRKTFLDDSDNNSISIGISWLYQIKWW